MASSELSTRRFSLQKSLNTKPCIYTGDPVNKGCSFDMILTSHSNQLPIMYTRIYVKFWYSKVNSKQLSLLLQTSKILFPKATYQKVQPLQWLWASLQDFENPAPRCPTLASWKLDSVYKHWANSWQLQSKPEMKAKSLHNLSTKCQSPMALRSKSQK